jgi:hypothetical protein
MGMGIYAHLQFLSVIYFAELFIIRAGCQDHYPDLQHENRPYWPGRAAAAEELQACIETTAVLNWHS